MLHLTTTCPADTETLARDLARMIAPGTVVLLQGDLGMGKTLFARAFIREITRNPDLNVTSPTFNLASTYDTDSGAVWHFDLYRLKHADELEEVGFYAALSGRAVLIEWPDRMGDAARYIANDKKITITIKGDAEMNENRVIEIDTGAQIRLPRTAFIFAAGLGERMRPLTDHAPKPLVEVAGRPILAYLFDMLADAGVSRVVLNTFYHADQIAAFVDAYRNRFEILISHEDERLETGGGLKKALPLIEDEVFYAINGDSLLIDGPGMGALPKLAAAYDPTQMDMMLLLQSASSNMITPAVGDYHMAADGRLVRALDQKGGYMFTGARIMHARVLNGTPDGKFSFLQCMDAAQNAGRLFGLEHTGDWHHLSTPEDVQVVSAHIQTPTRVLRAG